MFNLPINFCVAVKAVIEFVINVSNLKVAANTSNIKISVKMLKTNDTMLCNLVLIPESGSGSQ